MAAMVWGNYLKNPNLELFQYFIDAQISNTLAYFEMSAVEAVPVTVGESALDDKNAEKNDANASRLERTSIMKIMAWIVMLHMKKLRTIN